MLPIQSTRPDPRSAHLRVDRVVDTQAFDALRGPWNDLIRDSRADSVFLTWEWLNAWWTLLGGDRDLQVIVVWDGDELVGLAPLARTRRMLPWLSRLEFLGTGGAGSDYLDVVVRHGYEDASAQAIADALVSSKQALHFDHLPSDSVVASALVHRIAARSWTSLQNAAGTCPYILLAGHSWDSYLASIGAAHRANFRRRLRALDRQGAVRFARVSNEAERREVLQTLMSLHNRRWDIRGGSTAFPTPACRAFHYGVTRRMLERGWLRLYALRLNDVITAATYCFSYNGRFYFYQGAFDDRFQQHSVGMVAMGLTIRAAIEEGAREFDMLYGVESYKWLWARHARSLHRIELFPPDTVGRLHHRIVRAERTVRTLARRMFPRKPCHSNLPPAGVAC